MKLKIVIAIFVVAALPACAWAQKPPKPTNADAQKVVRLISGDKAKAKAYCDISKLGEEIDQADQKKDTKKVTELSKKMDELSEKIGPEYVALMDGMQDVDQNSKLAQDISATLEQLDKLCGK